MRPLIHAMISLCLCSRLAGAAEERNSPGDPYVHASLAKSSNAEVERFMGRGENPADVSERAKIKNQLPEGFWSMEPKAAALALLEANRTVKHRQNFRLVFEVGAELPPKGGCSVSLTRASSRCYQSVDFHSFLCVDPEKSYLAFAQDDPRDDPLMLLEYEFKPVHDLRFSEVSHQDAQHVAKVIWWLNRVRARAIGKDSEDSLRGMMSTADGLIRLVMRSEDKKVLDEAVTRWAGYLSERWVDRCDAEVAGNFAHYLIEEALPARQGASWSAMNVGTAESHQARLKQLSLQFLEWISPDQRRVSFGVATQAVRLVGWEALGDYKKQLQQIESVIQPDVPRHDQEKAAKELATLPYPFEIKDIDDRSKVADRRAVLEVHSSYELNDPGGDRADHLRAAAVLALRRMECVNDVERLRAWAESASIGSRWALQRLKQVNRDDYASVLEQRLHQAASVQDRDFFEELRRVDEKRSQALFLTLSEKKKQLLGLHAHEALSTLKQRPTSDTQMTADLLGILLDAKASTNERIQALGVLVPTDAVLHDASREVDEALDKLLTSAQPAKLDIWLRRAVCRALARRGLVDSFDTVLMEWQNESDLMHRQSFLSILSHLAQADPQRLNVRLSSLLKPQLAKSNESMTEVFWNVWAADLRELTPEIVRLATRSPGEIEDERANSWGGEVKAITGRFHFARQILGLWHEPDELAKARMLMAFAFSHNYSIMAGEYPERQVRWKTAFRQCVQALPAEARPKLDSFLEEISHMPVAREIEPISDLPDARSKIVQWIRACVP